MKPDLQNLKALTEMPPPKTKKELKAFLGIMNYLSTFSPSTASICESLRQLKVSKTKWTWNETYQKLFDKAKSIIKRRCMYEIFMMRPNHCTWRQMCLEFDVELLYNKLEVVQVTPRDKAPHSSILRAIVFTSKSLSSMDRRFSNIERGSLGILHGLKKFCHYSFVREVSIITDHKPLVVIFKKDVATLSQRIQ